LLKSYDLLNNNNNKPEYEKPKEESFLFYWAESKLNFMFSIPKC
jgi:hypothetical protein